MNETAIDTKAIEAIDAEVNSGMAEYVKRVAMPLELIAVTAGKANPPDAIKSQRIATAEQQQRQFTELERKKAEDNRKGAETSRALADNAYRGSLGLSAEQFVRLEAIKAQREICAESKCTFIIGNAVPVIGRGE